MRILIAGGSGLVGRAVVKRLRTAGHAVLLGTRRPPADHDPGAVHLDFAALPAHADLVGALGDVDAVVNLVGIFQPQAEQTFDAMHVKGPRALFQAAVDAGVRRLVQVSALGAREDADTAYFASKARADAFVLGLPASGVVVRPSLVFAVDGPSTVFLARLASAPVTPLPDGGYARVQPVHVDDLADAIALLATGTHPVGLLDAAGPRELALREYLDLLARGLGRRPRFLSVPLRLVAPLLHPAARVTGGLVGPDAMRMLAESHTADPGPLRRLLSRELRDPASFLDRDAARRIDHQLHWRRALAWMRLALAAMWLGTAWVSLFGYPRAGSHALLARLGLHGELADVALWSGALLDAGFGVLTLVAPRRTLLYRAQLLLVLAYTLLISLWLPEFWLHPFGPLLKNLPIVAMILVLHALDRDDGPAAR